MADALVSLALEKLADALGQQLTLFVGATDELRRLQKTFQHVKAVLHDAESKQVNEETVRLWLSELRQIAYDIDDLLDKSLVSELEKDGSNDDADSDNGSEAGNRLRPASCLPSPYNCLEQSVSRYKFARKIKEIRERLDQIAKDKDQFNTSHLNSFGGDRRPVRRSPTLTSSHMEEEMIGRDDDKDALISRLVSGSSSDDGQVQVIAIVGIGGLGKTTLARKIYHDGKARDHFEKLIWVCVSEDFDLRRLIKAITEQVKGTSTSFFELDSLQNELLEALRGKHFLLVLDDVWNDDKDKWNRLRPCLSSGAPGSRILVTTRLQKVAAKTMNASHIHELKGLSGDDCWMLFSCMAFDGWKEEEYLQLESVGRDIVNKCRGVPLSIKVMGRAMNSKKTLADWQNILDSKMWSLPEAETKILPALWLSYYNLPSQLKQCFAYCSIYPKDTVMNKNELVKLWIAQGFVQSQGNREVEDIGAEYFDDLVASSMFQEYGKDGNRCKIHDLLHDLAEFLTKDETCIYTSEKSNQCCTSVRHASLFFSGKTPNVPMAPRGTTTLRTLFLHGVDGLDTTLVNLYPRTRFLRSLLFRNSRIKSLPKIIGKLRHLRYLDLSHSLIRELPNAIGKLKSLRYLDLSRSIIKELPNDIGKMKNLRYLGLFKTKLAELPESVSRLSNLHTLNLSSCSSLKKLPAGMGGMRNLRHLQIANTFSLGYLPKGLGKISSLQSLSRFIVGGEGGCSIDELQQLNSLQGSLAIENLEKVSSRGEAMKAELWNKSHLRNLVLRRPQRDEIVTPATDAELENMASILERLRPHANLEELEIFCHVSSKFPSWMDDLSFSKLTKLKITGFTRCQQNLPGLGKLPSLKYLELRAVGVKKVDHELYYGNSGEDVVGRSRAAFPKLEKLILGDMAELVEWELTSVEADAGTIIMPSLHSLRLDNCPKLEGLSHHLVNTPLTHLNISRCPGIKGTGCSSFPLVEEFIVFGSGTFFLSGMPDFPNVKKFLIGSIRNETLPDGGWDPLMALHRLEITGCSELRHLPDGLRQLHSLENLVIIRCEKVEWLPPGLGQLKKLKSLLVVGLKALTSLPDSLSELESLEDLHLDGLEILQSLPDGLGQLKKLRSLRIIGAEALTCLPDSLGELESLENLNMNGLKTLQFLPEGFGQIKKLKSLTIIDAEALTYLPDSLGELESLEDLTMVGLKKLQSLPKGLGQLKKLMTLEIAGAEELTCLPDSVGELESLEDLDMDGLKKLQSLPAVMGQLKKLESLTISGAEALTSLPDSLTQLESLEYLTIAELVKLESLPHWLGQFKKLSSLTIRKMEAMTCLPDSLGQLESLKRLTISHCKQLKLIPHVVGQLESLTIDHLQALTRPHDTLGQQKSLKFLTIRGLDELESLPHSLRQLKELRRLIISDCSAIRSLPPGLQDLPLLDELQINNCPLLSERCKREGGEDWCKISSISRIIIDEHIQ